MDDDEIDRWVPRNMNRHYSFEEIMQNLVKVFEIYIRNIKNLGELQKCISSKNLIFKTLNTIIFKRGHNEN